MDGKLVHLVFLLKIWKKKIKSFYLKKKGKFRDHKRSNYQYNISTNIYHLLVIFERKKTNIILYFKFLRLMKKIV